MAMTKWTCFDGKEHPVSAEFTAKVPAELNGVPFQVLKAQMDSLLAMSNADVLEGGRELTDAEKAKVAAITHVLNLNRALAFMGGRDYREVLGKSATLDQVHGNSVTKDCGCVLQTVFDHNKRHLPGLKTYPHHSKRACTDHAHLKDDFAAHHKAFEG
jgi:hypothetical protein